MSEEEKKEQESVGAEEAATGDVQKKRIAIAAVVACLAGAAIAVAVTLGVTGGQSHESSAATQPQTSQEQAADGSSGTQEGAPEAVHKHDWVAQYETVHHDAVTHVVHHDAVFENQTVYSTVCNTCGAVLDDGKGNAHIAETGHKGFTKDVPHIESVKVKDAWDETVTDKDAYDETVLKDYKCSTCGVTASPEDVQKDTANQPVQS